VKPWRHARNSARKYGGRPEDYQDIHDFLDSPKVALPDVRFRAVTHNAWGCYLVERVFGVTRVNGAGRTYSPRDVAEDHVLEDYGFRIPTLEWCLRELPLATWMGGNRSKVAVAKLKQERNKED